MNYKKFVILGAGPSGLAFAHALLDRGFTLNDLVVIEKQSVAGGLCRSEFVDGAPLDIGGGHFLDLKQTEVLDFLFRFMPRDEWRLYDRVSKIRIREREVDHPLEANIWQLPKELQVHFLESIAQSGSVRGEEMPESFAAWVGWKLGEVIAQEYMLPYNRKIWSMDLNQLGTYWLHKLPDVSFREILRSCLEGKPMGALPAHGTFLYPMKFGYGEVWRRMGESLGDSLVTNCPVEHVDLATRTINRNWQAQTIVSTIPWTLWPDFCEMPKEILASISRLKNSSINVDYHSESLNSRAHWIYEPDESIAHHRLLLRSNFAHGARGHWTEANASRSKGTAGTRFHNEFAYPINTLGKPETVQEVLAWGESREIVGLGRWGRWDHMNSDVAVAEALQMASELSRQEGE